MKPSSFGILGEFNTEESYLTALGELAREGYNSIETYTPYAVDGEEEVLPRLPTPIGVVMLVAGITGGISAFFMQWYAARDYPINVGGRPLNSWPAFIPVTFELTVLSAALAGVATLLFLARFPRLHHPVFSAARFQRATQDRFFICVRPTRRHSELSSRAALIKAGAESVEVLPP
ncbi:MAG TPA: DUF3341 domain-containing protein [Opitutaceae bacterium]|nr:DUF3341 domain-containing protein [Opitutaceae bacterium]